MRTSNYEKFPSVEISGDITVGWDKIREQIEKKNVQKIVIETYHGTIYNSLKKEFQKLKHDTFIDTASLLRSEAEINEITYKDVTDDAIFGYITRLELADFLCPAKVNDIKPCGKTIIFGYGASLVCPDADIIIYADMPRWEIQMRQRKKEVSAIGVNDSNLSAALQYKRSFFVDWRICDKQKKRIFNRVDFWLDTTINDTPKIISGETMLNGLNITSQRPFRVVPFFDPAPWGGQWMKTKCGLDLSQEKYGWCFDCVPEENSLMFNLGGTTFEMPSINLVFNRPEELLGRAVRSRFGEEFPIRFDFLDTIGGGNLSLQVHPTKQFIRDSFGMDYTQDESYYILDAEDNAIVYLGVKDCSVKDAMLDDLRKAQEGGEMFDADKYTNRFPAKKHDHFLIPNGTIHCSGSGAMVLEISATPYIFTFKLWDWGRLGLDGKPRPINIERGKEVIDFRRNAEFCERELINHFEDISSGEGWKEERTGLHEMEFIETRRHTFTSPTEHNTYGGVNVINLVDGSAAIVSSPVNAFPPFEVHYAETFIIPASVGKYIITPLDGECKTLKAYVRTKQ